MTCGCDLGCDFLLQPRGGWLLRSAWHNNENSDTENMSIFHCAHSKGLEFSAICLDVTVDVITSRSRAICMDVSLDVNFRGPALAGGGGLDQKFLKKTPPSFAGFLQ